MNILETLEGKWTDGTRPKDLYKKHVSTNPETYLEKLIQGLESNKKRVQNGSAELISLLSKDHPDLLAPYIDKFIENLEAKAPVLRWEASCTLGNLAEVDMEKKIPQALPSMYPHLEHKSIVLANHTAQALAKIAEYNPQKAEEILDKLIEKAPYFTSNKVGFIIEAMVRFREYDELVPKVKEFVEPFLESEIKIVARKAKKTLKKIS